LAGLVPRLRVSHTPHAFEHHLLSRKTPLTLKRVKKVLLEFELIVKKIIESLVHFFSFFEEPEEWRKRSDV
jgi:hypothetical protein